MRVPCAGPPFAAPVDVTLDLAGDGRRRESRGVSPFRVHDQVLYLPGCSCQCSHLSPRQSVVILSALSFENHRKHPLRPQGSNLLRALLEIPNAWLDECWCGVSHVRRSILELRHCFQGAKLIFQLQVLWWELICLVIVQNFGLLRLFPPLVLPGLVVGAPQNCPVVSSWPQDHSVIVAETSNDDDVKQRLVPIVFTRA